MTDSLMMSEQYDLMTQQMTRESFDAKLESHRQKFYANMKNQISVMLPESGVPDAVLPEIGQRFKFNIYDFLNRKLLNFIPI